MEQHIKWMQYCIELGKKALKNGDPPVGSVLIRGDSILGEGVEAGKSQGDITYHAEIEALRGAVRNTGKKYFTDTILYTTHEPCIMCSYVIRHHRVAEVVVGLSVPEIGGYSSAYPVLIAEDIGVWTAPPKVIEGVLAEQCQVLQEQFLNQKQQS